jgi:hypothetical protein
MAREATMNTEMSTAGTTNDTDERDPHDGVTFLPRRRKSAVFAAPVVMALWQEQVFHAFEPPEVRRSA